MLSQLDIRDVVLIEKLSLDGNAGLVALTGETGAGKSILLDALGLALGARAEAALVRHGAEQASVTASFDLPKKHFVRDFLKEKDIAFADTLILRRTVGKDGRSKAYINDAPVSVQLLKETGALLVEIHGQFDNQRLLDPATHIETIDLCVGIDDKVSRLWQDWKAAKDRLKEAEIAAETFGLQEEYLRHAVKELQDLNPQPGEEATLAEKRQALLSRAKAADAFAQADEIIEGEDGLRALVGRLSFSLDRIEDAALQDGLSRLAAEVDDLSFRLSRQNQGNGTESLEEVEERYFAIKDCAKKHRCAPDDLPRALEDLSSKLRLVTDRDAALKDLRAAERTTKNEFERLAQDLTVQRKKAAEKLVKSVNAELPDLKLDKAKFQVEISALDEKDWHPRGVDRVQFLASTNPGAPAGPLHKTASGGEMSRFMLALKAVLAGSGTVPTLIFDEVDSGIGGATADAVGERLLRLAKNHQVLVITHSPQVAAKAAHHWRVEKTGGKEKVITRITPLNDAGTRVEEVARMLSGAEITKEARAQAAKLLKEKNAA